MPGYSDDGKATMLDHLAATITDLSLHDGDPGNVGANEVDGGGYARAAVTSTDWTAASSGAIVLDVAKDFDGPASQPVTHFGVWDGTTFLGGGAVSGDPAYNAEGDFTLDVGTACNLNA